MIALLFGKFKTYIILGAVIILAFIAIFILTKRLNSMKAQRDRWEQNYKADSSSFIDKSGAWVHSIGEKQLTIRELKNSKDSLTRSLYEQAKLMRLKDKQIDHLLTTKTSTRIDSVKIPIVDTLIIFKGDTLKRVSVFKSKWLDATIAIEEDSLNIINYEARDEIVVVINWYKEGKWFFAKWFERKKWQANIKSLNPKTNITYSNNIKITGKKGR